MYILGVHLGHHSSAALSKDGVVIGAVEEERFTRRKDQSGYPKESIAYVLSRGGISPEAVDAVAVPGMRLGADMPYQVVRRYFGYSDHGLAFRAKATAAASLNSGWLRRSLYPMAATRDFISAELGRRGFHRARVEFHDHHESHAASAFYSSPFAEALVLTQDGKGDNCSGSVFVGSGNILKAIARQPQTDSVGQIYHEVTRFLGFMPNRHEGKIMGMAAFGNPATFIDAFRGLVARTHPVIERSHVLDDANWRKGMTFRDRVRVLSNHPDNLDFEIRARKLQAWLETNTGNGERADVAAAVQQAVEDWMVELCRWHVGSLHGSAARNICLAGGLFANVKVNQRLRESVPGVRNIYIQPAMGDSGLSLGAAQLCWHRSEPEAVRNFLEHVFLGPDYSDRETAAVLEQWKERVVWERHENAEELIGQLLHEGNIVGRFNGPLEWGPRALGNRSILVRPTDRRINAEVNRRLRRTEFMPFAPSVLDYRAGDYFMGYRDDHIAADFMTVTYNVRPEKMHEIEAVVHVDNTARPQVVREKTNPSYHRILRAYERCSGIGCVVNTSFNVHEEPIVNSPEDALRTLEQGAVDVLAIGNYFVRMRGRKDGADCQNLGMR
ncbi:MAG: carbamoyltransferase C-terminal domain-containing protein [Caldimonas sp.]